MKLIKSQKKKWPEIPESELKARSEKIGLSSIKYFMACFNPETTITFDIEKSLSFNGKSGPYLLYTYARSISLLRKAGVSTDENITFESSKLPLLTSPLEHNIIIDLFWFPSSIDRTVTNYDTSKLADTIFKIAKSFGIMYKDKVNHPIVNCDNPELKQARLMLVHTVSKALKIGLNLLGIDVIEQM